MKHTKTIILFCLMSAIFSSCVYSLFPIYTLDTLTYDDKLLGTWEKDDTKIIIKPGVMTKKVTVKNKKFDGTIEVTETASEDDSQQELFDLKRKSGYQFIAIEGSDTLTYKAHLVSIGDEYYFNLSALSLKGNGEVNSIDPFENNLYPIHTFMKVSFNNSELALTSFHLDKLHKLFRKNMIRLRHEYVLDPIIEDADAGDIVITAKPKEIQKFIETYSKDPSVFSKPEVYNRL